jgi:putative membrane protein
VSGTTAPEEAGGRLEATVPEEAGGRLEGLGGRASSASANVRASAGGPLVALADGQWHRLHPASPLLKGGIALIAILGVVVANLRERLLNLVLPGYDNQKGDPVSYVLDQGLIGLVLLAVAVLLIILITGFYFSWRMHTFRITSEVVEVRSGIFFRTNRRARLDRIQGINIIRPFFARLFGAAKLEISQAGHDATVHLSYLRSGAADDLRREILRLASGTKVAGVSAAAPATKGFIDRRMGELVAPELDPNLAPPESVVRIHLGRLVGAIVLHETTVFLLIVVVAGAVWIAVTGKFFALIVLLPSIIGFGSFYVKRFTKSLQYTVAGTPDGLRVGFGLFSTSNETLPPGRIHAIQISQPLLWRPAGWWEIKINRAGHSRNKGAAGQANTTILPVGNLDDVCRVLPLILPGVIDENAVALIRENLRSRGSVDDAFTNSPHRAMVFRPLSWRRNGFAIAPGLLLLRKGFIWRHLVIVPQPRLQSVSLAQGPLFRAARLARVQLHTVSGPINATLGAVDRAEAIVFFDEVAEAAVLSARIDTTHRWRASEAPA